MVLIEIPRSTLARTAFSSVSAMCRRRIARQGKLVGMHLRVQPRAQRKLVDSPIPHVLYAASLCKQHSCCHMHYASSAA